MDVAAPKPKSRGSAIIFAKFKLSPSKVKNDKENNKMYNILENMENLHKIVLAHFEYGFMSPGFRVL